MKEYRFYGWETADIKDEKGLTPRDYYDYFTEAWNIETCAPRFRSEWSPANRTLGQCSITAFIMQDIYGGTVWGIPLEEGGYHCFNIVGDCLFDLASEQFGDLVLDYENRYEQFREDHLSDPEKKQRYELLKARLEDAMRSSCTNDCIVRATAAGETVRAFAIRSTDLVAEARELHYTFPVVTAALGRLLSAGAMMGSMMKGEDDKLTLQMKGDGPIAQMTVTADSHGNVKGFAANPSVDIPLKRAGKLDVGGAVGKGFLTVIMDLGLKEPYNGQVEIQTGEIGDDLAYYFTVSEQTPSVVGLGVMVDTDSSVKHAGGFILQVMPDAAEETIAALEAKVAGAEPVTTMMDKGMSPEDILEYYLGDLDLKINEKLPVRYYCGCSKEKVAGALATISTQDLNDLINEGEQIEVKCYFCNSAYKFGVDELKEMLGSRGKGE